MTNRTTGILLTLAGTIAAATAAAPPPDQGPDTFSVYVPVRDGTRLAVDVSLPAGRGKELEVPALVELTRYWRASEDPATGEPNPSLDIWERAFLAHGYAVVQVDVRGSGASFGRRTIEYGPREVRDGYDIVEWIVHQPWSDGKVGAHGVSYTGTTAELLTATGHPAVKAVSPGWSDFDPWRSPARPYGLHPRFIDDWGSYVAMLDRDDARVGGLVKRVDEDRDGSLRAAAIRQHEGNIDVARAVGAVDSRDQPLPGSGSSFADISVLRWKSRIEASGVPMLVIASWMDAAGAEGALWRFANFSNPQFVVLEAASHGGVALASPYAVGGEPVPPVPSLEDLIDLRLRFFDHYLKGVDNGVARWPRVRYWNLGEEAFRETDVWPPAGGGSLRMYAGAERLLSPDPPDSSEGEDRYEVDFEVSTGSRNRWMTQMGEPVLNLDRRGGMDERMLSYTSAPLDEDMQITGTPSAHIALRSTHPDGAVLIYLEDVDPEGRSRYLTEGGLRLLHRRIDGDPGFEAFGPVHSFAGKDAWPLKPGVPASIAIRLNPISVRVGRGHRLRLAIAGADAESFGRIPKTGTPVLTVERNAGHQTYVDLPVMNRAKNVPGR